MASLNSLIKKIRGELRDQISEETTLASILTIAGSTAKFDNQERVLAGDTIEIGTETLLLEEKPLRVSYLKGVANNTALYLTADDSILVANDIIKINEELMTVTAATGANFTAERAVQGTDAVAHDDNSLIYLEAAARVRRGYFGTTAAYHSADATVSVVDKWSNPEYETAAKDALSALQPYVFKDFYPDVRGKDAYVSIEDCQTIANWSASNDATSPTANTDNYKIGDQSINLGIDITASAETNGLYETTTKTTDASDKNYLNVSFWSEDITSDNKTDLPLLDENALTIRLGSSATDYYSYQIGFTELIANKWNQLSLAIDRYDTETGTVDTSVITYFAIQINENTLNQVDITSGNFYIDDIALTTYPIVNSKNSIDLPKRVFNIGRVLIHENKEDKNPVDTPEWYLHGHGDDWEMKLVTRPNEGITQEGKPITLIGAQKYEIPTDATATLDVTKEEEELVVLYSALRLIEQLANERLRFDRYSSKFNRENAVLLDVIRQKNSLQERYNQVLSRNERGLKAAQMDWGSNDRVDNKVKPLLN